MSVALVRKVLELNKDPSSKKKRKEVGPQLKETRGGSINGKKRKVKLTKKQLAEKVIKQNLKLLKALETPESSLSKKQRKQQQSNAIAPGNSKSEKTAFTEEDFKKFEEEYFVTQ